MRGRHALQGEDERVAGRSLQRLIGGVAERAWRVPPREAPRREAVRGHLSDRNEARKT